MRGFGCNNCRAPFPNLKCVLIIVNFLRRPFLHSLAYFLPLIYAAPVYLLTWLVIRGAFSLSSFEAAMADTYGLGCWPALGTFDVALPLLFTITVIGEAVWGLGEELGWRGFLFPSLQQRFRIHGACLI